MNHDTKTSFLVFLFIFGAMVLSQRTHAALALTPTVPGYSGGNFSAPSGSFSMNAANDGFIKPATATVSGKPITVPASMRMAANAGNFAKNAMRLNPWAIVGTLAAGYLADHLLQWDEDSQSWQSVPAIYPGGTVSQSNACTLMEPGQYARDAALNRIVWMPQPPYPTSAPCPAPYSPFASCSSATQPYYQPGNMPYTVCINPSSANQPFPNEPFPDSAWDGLPDPLPIVGPELPDAPYMPGGVPVDAPEYDFVPFTTPVGYPYERPDGSTAQPMAKVSPNGDQVTVDTYDQPLTDANGDPVPSAPPEDTPEPQPESPTQCDKYPNSLGCAELGTVDDSVIPTESRSIASIAPVTVGGAGSCPEPLTADFMGQTVSFSYDMPCQFATSLKPLILAIAWLSAGLIFIGGVRQ